MFGLGCGKTSVFLFILCLFNMIFNSSSSTVLKSGWLMNNELENMQVYKIQGSHGSVTKDFNPIQKNFVVVSFDAVFWHFPSGTEDRQ